MITANGFEQLNTEVYNGQLVSKCKYDLVGLSTDTKPTMLFNGSLIANGSTLLNMDNGAVFMYDETNARWLPL
jgi:hypothetical protein